MSEDQKSCCNRLLPKPNSITDRLQIPISAAPAQFAAANICTEGFHRGITVTCPGFYGPQGRVLRLGLSQPDLIDRLTDFSYGRHRITNFEMETAGIYGLGKILGHSCLSLSAVVANRVTRRFSPDGNAAIEGLIQRTLGIVEGLG
jgi:uridine phosphorylase